MFFFLGICSPKVNVKLVILDEADAMTKEAQFSLRRSRPSQSHLFLGHNTLLQGSNLKREFFCICFSWSLFWMVICSHICSFVMCASYREIYKEHKVLFDMQLCEQNHTGTSITMHSLPLSTSCCCPCYWPSPLHHPTRKVRPSSLDCSFNL